MPRAYPISDTSDPDLEPQPGEWQALRGELVALLDQVEDRYASAQRQEPALDGLSQRVRNLRDQVVAPEGNTRRREALRTVKRAVDRFSDRDDLPVEDSRQDALSNAIAEIRGRQMSAPAAALGRRATDMPEFRELSSLVGGLSGRLERLETELKSQRASNGSVREVASQVEQLTHVVELLAGAVGETGQVKRLEAQIAALSALIEEGPKVDLTAINKRLDDVSGTVGKLAELQAQQMEREIVREDRIAATPKEEGASALQPAMHAIEKSVRNVYDRIDSIEKNVALSSGDFERLTSEMSAFTQAMKDREAAPSKLVAKVDALAARIGDFESSNGDVAGLKNDISALRDAVLAGMEPRFAQIETSIAALSERVAAPADTSVVESRLAELMDRMDQTGSQLDELVRLYSAPQPAVQLQQQDPAELEAMATLVAERTSDAMTRKAPAPVAMFGPDSLKSIEDRLSGLIRSTGKQPDYEAIAALVAEKTSEAVARATPAPTPSVSEESMSALEQRVAALFNTAGRDTAERLGRLEAALAARAEAAPVAAPVAAQPTPRTEPVVSENRDRLDAMLAALDMPEAGKRSDAMPANPAEDAPLIDPGFKNPEPVRAALQAKTAPAPSPAAAPAAARPTFDPASVQRPPRPLSSFAKAPSDPFAPPAMTTAPAPTVEAPVTASSTSTFVAAARRAQRARAESGAPVAAESNSLIGRALSRFKPSAPGDGTAKPEAPVKPPKAEKPAKPEKPAKAEKPVKAPKPTKAPEVAVAPPLPDAADAEAAPRESFITRHRRPLLLAGTLIVVSMLALNLVMQRMNNRPAQPAAAATTQPSATPSASDDVSLVAPGARIIDMIDNTTTATIAPASTATFAKPVTTTPMPPSLLTATAAEPAALTIDSVPVDATETAAIPAAVTFDLPPEAVGPLELRQAAADGDARAQFEIAAIYTEGRAVEQDYAEAAIWYERAAAKGFVPAQYRLGNLYETGTGVEQDIEQAKVWYQASADAGNRMAMHNLAALYAGGQLGDQQFETAAEWFTKAAERGMTDSQFNLGMLYARGLGVEQDFEQSYKWFSLAALGGDADAGKARDDIAKSLTADIVSRVNDEVAAWKATTITLEANFAPIGTWSPDFVPGDAITTREVVVKVQQALAKLGFDVGTPDGIAGAKTAEAIKAFERGTGMTEVGAINPRLLAVLGSQPV